MFQQSSAILLRVTCGNSVIIIKPPLSLSLSYKGLNPYAQEPQPALKKKLLTKQSFILLIDHLGYVNSMFHSNSEEWNLVEILISQRRLYGEIEVFKLTPKYNF